MELRMDLHTYSYASATPITLGRMFQAAKIDE